MLKRLLQHDILANFTFALVLVVGAFAYLQLPREQDPSVNFNWVNIWTKLPGASATEIEKRITEPLEDAVDKVADIKFVSSNSRQDVSTIVVRFDDVSEDVFDKRVSDLRREIQNKIDELPVDASRPEIVEISSANAFPTAIVLVTGIEDDENLRAQSRNVREDLERLPGVERIDLVGDQDPELQVLFSPERLVGLGVSPTDLVDTVTTYFRDLAAGTVGLGDQKWLIRLIGTDSDPQYLGRLPIVTASGEVPLRSVADVVRGRSEPTGRVHYDGQDAVMLQVFKKSDANILELVRSIKAYIGERNELTATTGVSLVLLDDQTSVIDSALAVMQNNALIGLLFVMFVTWFFLGGKIAVLTGLGIPFILAGTFAMLSILDQTLNVVVLLGVVISLGMLVDDAVVVVEAMYVRIQRGMEGVRAGLEALREVFAPVTTAVLTTIAAFAPLMLLPGVLGDFMRVIPIVVTCALLISLVEAYWMLPTHVILVRPNLGREAPMQAFRDRMMRWLRFRYLRLLVTSIRRPTPALTTALLMFTLSLGVVLGGAVRTDFFASDPFRFFYVNVQMPPGTSLEKTLDTVLSVEEVVKESVRPGEAREIAAYAGQRLTEREPLLGDQHGQVFVSLNPKSRGLRDVDEMIADMRAQVERVPGPVHVSFLRRSTGPPTSKPISIKVRGDDPAEIREAADIVIQILSGVSAVSDIIDDDTPGRMELMVRLNPDAVMRAGIDPASVIRAVRLFADGEVVASMQHQGEKLEVRVRARAKPLQDIDGFLRNTLSLPNGGEISLAGLVDHEIHRSKANVRHFDLRRAITVEAELDKRIMDTVEANKLVREQWALHGHRFPNVDLDFSGELDDIQESIESIAVLFLVGLGLIYAILGTQFKSYVQPVMVLATVPMAFTGVVVGLLVSGNPLSVYTLYGIVALAGIAVNSAIVLISAANSRISSGMSVVHATVYAARRRVIPILITSLTTIAGLLSLAIGLGGESLMWGPIASVIVWGLGVSTLLTLFVIPILYIGIMRLTGEVAREAAVALPLEESAPATAPALSSALHWLIHQNASGTETDAVSTAAPADSQLVVLRKRGLHYLKVGQLEEGIRTLEQAAQSGPRDLACNVYAAQALIIFMQKNGWDEGYGARAERYLRRAQRLNPSDQRVRRVELAYAQLKAGASQEA